MEMLMVCLHQAPGSVWMLLLLGESFLWRMINLAGGEGQHKPHLLDSLSLSPGNSHREQECVT